jgi:signal-transduction protein with cAMP-binding, CBS, and nucleotidyltransferase domain
MDTLQQLLNNECDYRMQEATMERFLGMMTEIRLKNNEAMIPYGKTDDGIYVVKEGLIRRVYFDGLTEKTYAFAAKGTVLFSFHSFYKGVPSVFQYESCGESIVYRASKRDIDELQRQSHDFTAWMSRIYLARLYHWEKKTVLIAGNATERFEALLKNRPEIIDKVPLKIIASYIGISPQWLSTLKNRLMPK